MKARVPQNTINRTRRTGTISLVHLGKSNKKISRWQSQWIFGNVAKVGYKNYATNLLKHTIERKNYVAIAA